MAKAATATKPPVNKGGKEVATRAGKEVQGASAEDLAKLDEMMAGDAGKGVSTAMEDNIVPLIYILQALSPQVNKKKEEYVQGAEAGMIWFRGSKTVVSGEEGIPVVPVTMSKSWVEWQPNRGGFVMRHDDKPADAVQVTDAQNPKKKFWQRKSNGNTVVETREHVVIVLEVFESPRAFVIPMSGSGHGSSRAWMTKQNEKRVPNREDLKSPAYGYIYDMKLKFNSNDQGDWYMWDVVDHNDEPTRLTDVATYLMARQMEEDFKTGAKKAANMDADQVDDTADGGGGTNAKGQRASDVL